jgi:hypothetical protein
LFGKPVAAANKHNPKSRKRRWLILLIHSPNCL